MQFPPQIQEHIRVYSVIFTLGIAGFLGSVSIGALGNYGWTVFLFIPFLIGFLPPFLVGKVEPIKFRTSLGLSFLTLGIGLLCLLGFLLEGMLCIVMALPIIALMVLIGCIVGYRLNRANRINPAQSTIAILLICVGTMSFDVIQQSEQLIPVKTRIVVDAPAEAVWEHVVTFSTIPEPMEWIFKTGISYPIHATISGVGVGAVRYCNFTTGSFVEPITTWDAPHLLQFDVAEHPVPLQEYNPFAEIHPPHLDGYFLSRKGQFRLTELSDHQTELEGTTWYTLDILPQVYWKLWSDVVVHSIHKRVLEHIKQEAEKNQPEQK